MTTHQCDNPTKCDIDTCQSYQLLMDDEEMKHTIDLELQILYNFLKKDKSGQIGSFLQVSTWQAIAQVRRVWKNYLNRKKWKKGKKIPRVVLRDLALKVKDLSIGCLAAELKATIRTLKANQSFEWDYKDKGDGTPRVQTIREIVDEVFAEKP